MTTDEKQTNRRIGQAQGAALDDAAFATLLGEAAPGPEVGGAPSSTLKQRVARERGVIARLRAMPLWMRGGLMLLAVVLLAALMVFGTPRPDLAYYPKLRLAAILLGFGALLIWLVLAAFRPMHKAPPKKWLLGLLLGLGIAAPVVVAGLPHAYHSGGHTAPEISIMMPLWWQCLLFGSVTALPVVALGWLLDRGGFFSVRRWIFAGLAAVLAGNIMLMLHCPNPEPLHLLTGHATVLGPVLVLIFLLWRLWFRR